MPVPLAPVPPAPPGAVQPALQVAAEHLAAGRPAEAVHALQDLVAGAPIYAAAHVLLATALEAAGRPADALAAWHRAAFLVPRSPLVHRERQRLLSQASSPPDEPAVAAPEADTLLAGFAADSPPETPPAEDPEREMPEADPTADAPLADSSTPAEAHAGSLPDGDAAEPDDGGQPAAEDLPLEALDRATDAIEPDATDAAPWADPDPMAGDPADELPALQTLPIGDLALSFDAAAPGTDDDPDGFDPDGFDFSAFDVSEDSDPPDWLTPADSPSIPHLDKPGLGASDRHGEAEMPEPAEAAPVLADWADDDLPDTSVRLLPPEGGPAPARPPEPADDWTVLSEDFAGEDELVRPTAPDEPPAPPSVADELDSLIASLEHAPRIRPDPAFRGPPIEAAPPDVDEMVSETLAKIYAAQHQYVEAAVIYEKLAAREPARADELLGRAADLRRRA